MTLMHDVTGHGPAVVLLHSSVCDRRMWDAQWKVLAESGHQVVRCDFRGFGETPAEEARPYEDSDDVLALLDDLGIKRATLIGASHGGQVAVEFAARHPERVNALVLLCAGLPGYEPGPALRDFGGRENALLEADDLDGAVELNVSTWLGPEADEPVRERVRAMQRHAFEVQLAAYYAAQAAAEAATAEEPVETAEAAPEPPFDLAAIQARTLVVTAAHDVDDFRTMGALLADGIPGADRVELPWAGHLPSLERPDEVTALLTGFLSGLSSR
ncbi:alpha/beta fold hydrolase [Streptomyces sp. NPDC127084]|uniref:alpha/beta fold hydrolase n=1 Tax=Streptomyces sp. NPDC127084 TaxID=3347133 RepID=UPI003651D031